MKRLLQILLLLIVLTVGAAIVLPIVFKDEILARVKTEINKNLNATVDFEDIDISLFRSFPDFSLGIETFTVDGKEKFEGVRLADVESFVVDLNLFSVIKGSEYEVERIVIENAHVHVLIDTSGNANYDITIPSDEVETDTAETASNGGFKLSLKEYSLKNFNLVYDDQAGGIKAVIKELDHTGTGDFTEEVVNLQTQTEIKTLDVLMDGIAYMSKVHAVADVDLSFNQTEFSIAFGENHISLNNLPLEFSGSVVMPAEDIDMDLEFNSPGGDFKSLLSLIPAVYTQDFDQVKTQGQFAFAGNVKGTYNGDREEYPTYDISLNVNNASFRYPDLPAGVENINVDMRVVNPRSDLDGTEVHINKASATVANSPINARVHLKNLMSDPDFDAYLKTNFDLEDVARVVPSSGFDYKGTIAADFATAGKISYIENENYEALKAEGGVVVNNMVLKSDSLPYTVAVENAALDFSPQYAALKSFKAQIGASDLSANGRIDNLIGYALNDELLAGDFSISSQKLDLNELSGGSETPAQTTEEPASESSLEVIRIPQNIDFKLTADVQQVLYDNLAINDVKGVLQLKEGAVQMQDVLMSLLGGQVAMNGSYDSKPATPVADMNIKVNRLSFKESFKSFVTIQKLAPIMETAEGTYSLSLTANTNLGPDMMPELNTMQASGSLLTQGLKASPEAFSKIANAVKNPSLATLNIGNVDLNFTVEDGRVEVEPFDIKAGNVSATVQGSNGLDQTLDYVMNMKIPVSGIGASNLLNQLGASQNGTVDLGVNITGTVTNPKVSTSLGDIVGNVVDNLKNQAKEKVEEVVEDTKQKINEKAQQLIDEAEAKGDQLIAAAEKQAANLRAEAKKRADQLRSEADKKATKLVDDAQGNFIKERAAQEGAKKLRSEADEAASKIESEANNKGQGLIDQAKAQKEKLVAEAREKATVK